MKKTYLLGIDIGTTNWKVCLFDTFGKTINVERTPTIVHHDKHGCAYYQPEEIWKQVCRLIRKTIRITGLRDQIRALAVASMGETGIPLDKNGKCVYPAIAWFDTRTEPQKQWFEKCLGNVPIYKITGLNLHYIYSANKILWLKSNHPDIYRRTVDWLCLPDYLVYRMTGEKVTEYTIASRTMLLDLKALTWSKKMLDVSGINERLLPRIVPSGTAVGKITKQASLDTGLSMDTIVVTGGHDHVCSSFAAGVTQPGKYLDSIGTAETVLTPVDKPVLTKNVFNTGLSYGMHVSKQQRYIKGGLYGSGGSIEWFIDRFYATNKSTKNELYRMLINEATASVPGSRGIFFLPHLQGSCAPYRDVYSRAAFIGLTSKHNRSDIINSIFEGLCYQSRQLLETIEKVLNKKCGDVVVVGGATKNEHWMQVKANIFYRRLIMPQIDESASLGAAMLAGLGAGVYKNESELMNEIKIAKKYFKPNKSLTEIFDKRYEIFKNIYPALKGINWEINSVNDK